MTLFKISRNLDTACCTAGKFQYEDFRVFGFLFDHRFIFILEEVVLSWIEMVSTENPCILQPDSALYHTSRRTQYWLSENFCDLIDANIWLPNSPNGNPFIIMSGVQRNGRTNKTLCDTQDEVKAKITTEFTNLNKESVGTACMKISKSSGGRA